MNDLNNSVDSENKKHIVEVYLDKAYSLLIPCVIAFIISFISYFVAFNIDLSNWGIFFQDFGIYFEVFSFFCIFIALNTIKKHNIPLSKKFIIMAMIPEGFLFIYDVFNVIANFDIVLSEIVIYSSRGSLNTILFILNYLDITVIAVLIFSYLSFSALSVADGTKKDNSFEKDFYDNI